MERSTHLKEIISKMIIMDLKGKRGMSLFFKDIYMLWVLEDMK
jgi:hypothetical protein